MCFKTSYTKMRAEVQIRKQTEDKGHIDLSYDSAKLEMLANIHIGVSHLDWSLFHSFLHLLRFTTR
jgi:ssRNA-specific RNase YbeY (16S rRNA maturation enzyme)